MPPPVGTAARDLQRGDRRDHLEPLQRPRLPARPGPLHLALAAPRHHRAKRHPPPGQPRPPAASSPSSSPRARWDVALLQECPPRWAAPARRLLRSARCTARSPPATGSPRPRPPGPPQPRPARLLGRRLEPDPGRGALGDGCASGASSLARAAGPSAARWLFTRLACRRSASRTSTPAAPTSSPSPTSAWPPRPPVDWAGDDPLILGGDFNLRPSDQRPLPTSSRSGSASSAPPPPTRSTTCSSAASRSSSPPARWPPRGPRGPADGLRHPPLRPRPGQRPLSPPGCDRGLTTAVSRQDQPPGPGN